MERPYSKHCLELWGGLECTINRVGDRFKCQLTCAGHENRLDDIDRIASLGIQAVRYPVLWERVSPEMDSDPDWKLADYSLPRFRELGVRPIVGLTHHGSGPRHTDLLDADFPSGLASHARAVAERFPWVKDFTPVNEPLTTARFSALYGIWYPHARDAKSFAQAVVNQVKAVVLSMREIRKVNPSARLVQTDDLGKTHSTSPLRYQADFENHRRWLTWDLLDGRVLPGHPMWDWFELIGYDTDELLWLADNPCPADLIGVNHYLTSERFLDHRVHRYPEYAHGDNGIDCYADIEAVRVLLNGCAGPEGLLREARERYGRPVAVTECHLGCTREEQLRWLRYVWDAASRVEGVEAVTVWSLLGAYDWNSLLQRDDGHYEPGVFDLRAPVPRETALAGLMRRLAAGDAERHPTENGEGWWERPVRLEYPAVPSSSASSSTHDKALAKRPPLLLLGQNGTLGQAFARLAEVRGLEIRSLGRNDIDLARPDDLLAALEAYRPWAVVNCTGYVRVDEAESNEELCRTVNGDGASAVAEACAELGIPSATFSSDLVFDGSKGDAYVENDLPNPLNAYGRSKALAERRILGLPDALVVRTSAFFGPWDQANFLHQMIHALSSGRDFEAASDLTVSPTYVPDLVNATLDLLIDGEEGLWHLTNQGEATWADFARRAALLTGMDETRILPKPHAAFGWAATRPRSVPLRSERGWIMPELEDAMERWTQQTPILAQKNARFYLS